MTAQARSSIFRLLGVCSPYVAVLVGLFHLKNVLAAVLFYHVILLVSILGINGKNQLGPLLSGFHPYLGPLICVGGLLPGFLAFYLWPAAMMGTADLAGILADLNLGGQALLWFAVYACMVNPFLEEAFWRGCFKHGSILPNHIDMLFAGYHALAVTPILKPLYTVLVFLAMTFVGWLFRNLYRITGGLLIPLLTHLIADIAILYAVWQIVRHARL